MNLRAAIIKEHSKNSCERIVKWIGDSQQRFDELFDLFLHDEPLVVQRAAWPLSYAVAASPGLIHKHLGTLLKYVRRPGKHEAVKRNTVRLLEAIDIPDKYQGGVMNLCFDYIQAPGEKPAVKAFSLGVLQKMLEQYPEIGPELQTLIEDRWDYESAAFRSRAKKILKVLSSKTR